MHDPFLTHRDQLIRTLAACAVALQRHAHRWTMHDLELFLEACAILDTPDTAELAAVPEIAIERRHRHTIMDGRVVTFATHFRQEDGILTNRPHEIAMGPFEISSSRNAVMVHRADLREREDFLAFLTALDRANDERAYLERHDGRPPKEG